MKIVVVQQQQPCWSLAECVNADHKHTFWNCPEIDSYLGYCMVNVCCTVLGKLDTS